MEVDAYLSKLLGPGFKLTHRSFDMEDMTVEFDETTQCYKIPITGTVGYYRATVVKLFKRSGKLHVTVGYIPTASADDSIINPSSDTPTKYMDYLFERQSGSWYLTGLTESETKPESAASSAAAAHGGKRCAGRHSGHCRRPCCGRFGCCLGCPAGSAGRSGCRQRRGRSPRR